MSSADQRHVPPHTTDASTITGSQLNRRRFLTGMAGAAAALAFSACGPGLTATKATATAAAGASAVSKTGGLPPLPASVPAGTKLSITSSGTVQLQLQLSGLTLPFTVSDYVNVSGGPDVINAFRSGSLDLASNAGIPPIQAESFGGIDARIVNVGLTRVPTYVFVTRPGSDIQTVKDFKGKKLAFSPGQAQGIVLLRALDQVGLTSKDVTLVELNSTQFLTALQAKQVDIGVLAVSAVFQYLNQYGKDGAHQIATDVIDRLSILWAPGKTLKDEAKVAAIAAYLPIYAKAQVWQWEHPDLWIQKWYVENQQISAEQGKAVVAAASKPYYPPTWDEALEWEQKTADLMAAGGWVKPLKTESLFDRRFEGIASKAVAEEYRRA